MDILEQKVPLGSIPLGSDKSYAEKQFLGSYMSVNPSSVYDCGDCNNCGSGDCASCCGSGGDN